VNSRPNIPWSALAGPLSAIGGSNHRVVYTHLVTERAHSYFGTSQLPAVFDAQIRFLTKYYDVITLSEAVRRAKAGDSLKGTASISTDDGFVENYTTIAPILESYGVTGTFFCVSECIDNRTMMWRSQIFHLLHTTEPAAIRQAMHGVAERFQISQPAPTEGLLEWSAKWDQERKGDYTSEIWNRCARESLDSVLATRLPYLTSVHLKDLVARGHSIGSHSVTHPICPRLPLERFVSEVLDSADELSELSGSEVRLFAYPFGQRPSPELESAIANTASVDALLGISSTLRNGDDPLLWERDNLEFGSWRSQAEFSLKPWARRLKHSKLFHR
jgi:peptidoglycan/xylan/chitin deacetylase (PgdA/CDA1 family)